MQGLDQQPQSDDHEKKARAWPWALGALVVLVIALSGTFTPGPEDPQGSAPASSSNPTSSANATRRPGSSFYTDDFAVRVPSSAIAEFTTSVGSGYSVRHVKDAGTYYCLVPVCVSNVSASTNSFLPLGWYLHADGYRFETASGVDYYLADEDRLDAIDVPPGITRCGKIVFLVTSVARRASVLELELNDWGSSARFEVPE